MNSQAENNEAGWPSNRAPALLPAETAERNIEVAREPSGMRGFLFRSSEAGVMLSLGAFDCDKKHDLRGFLE